MELLIHSNRCITGVGGCRLYDYFAPYFETEVVHDSDGCTRTKLIGNPDRGAAATAPASGPTSRRSPSAFPSRCSTISPLEQRDLRAARGRAALPRASVSPPSRSRGASIRAAHRRAHAHLPPRDRRDRGPARPISARRGPRSTRSWPSATAGAGRRRRRSISGSWPGWRRGAAAARRGTDWDPAPEEARLRRAEAGPDGRLRPRAQLAAVGRRSLVDRHA